MNPVSVDVKDKLVAGSHGTFAATTGWSIFIGSEPDAPDTAITIYDEQPDKIAHSFNNSLTPVEFDLVNVRVRGPAYIAAHTKIRAIITELDRIAAFTAAVAGDTDAYYSSIIRRTGPFYLGPDESARHIWVCNFKAVREELAT